MPTIDQKPADPPRLIELAATLAREGNGSGARAVRYAAAALAAARAEIELLQQTIDALRLQVAEANQRAEAAERHWLEDDRCLNELIAENEKLKVESAELRKQLDIKAADPSSGQAAGR